MLASVCPTFWFLYLEGIKPINSNQSLYWISYHRGCCMLSPQNLGLHWQALVLSELEASSFFPPQSKCCCFGSDITTVSVHIWHKETESDRPRSTSGWSLVIGWQGTKLPAATCWFPRLFAQGQYLNKTSFFTSLIRCFGISDWSGGCAYTLFCSLRPNVQFVQRLVWLCFGHTTFQEHALLQMPSRQDLVLSLCCRLLILFLNR